MTTPFRHFITRGVDGYDLWGTYGSEELAEKSGKELKNKDYNVKIKMREDLRHNIVWDVYYKYKNC